MQNRIISVGIVDGSIVVTYQDGSTEILGPVGDLDPEELQEAVRKNSGDIAGVKRDIAALQQADTGYAADIDQLKSDRTEMRGDISDLEEEVADLKADLTGLDDRVTDLEEGSSGGSAAPMESITWIELKAKRDGGTLTPGMQYRITDYVCTTTQEESRAVSHPYDIIVTADNANTLNESARACLHDGDNYYSAEGHSANLKAWELKYCLDNDASRFAWADETNGKGVVYYLKDEKGNECPYDFKQIQFKRYKITECEKVPSLVGAYTASTDSTVITGIDADNPIWCYTFNYYGTNIEDATVLGLQHGDYGRGKVLGNKIALVYDGDLMALNNIVFLGSNGCTYNTFGNGCYSNTFGDDCAGNTFGGNCTNNIFGNGCYSNTFGNGCYENTFSNGCYENTFGNGCYSNTFGDDCYENTFSNGCYENTFGNSCNRNVFGDDCKYLKGAYDETSGTVTHLCHVLAGTIGSSDLLYELPTKEVTDKSVTYVGANSAGDIITWVPADEHRIDSDLNRATR